MGERGKYIYGMISGTARSDEGTPACPDGVHIVTYKDIAAVVADAEIVDPAALPKEALARLLLGHQKVVEMVMAKDVTIIPVRLGTFARSVEETMRILEGGYETILHVFRDMDGKVEDDVAALWVDPGLQIRQVAQEPEVRALREEVLAKKVGVTVEDQMKVGFLIKKRLDERRSRIAGEIVGILRDVSQSQKEHECLDDSMVMNEAFLVSRSGLCAFTDRLDELGRHFGDEIRFRCVGPLPAYSFATLEVKRIDSAEVDWARKRLGIGDYATVEEIKRAYRNYAFVYHPDRNIDSRDGDAEFQEVARAYKILKESCSNGRFSFSAEGGTSGRFVVRVRE